MTTKVTNGSRLATTATAAGSAGILVTWLGSLVGIDVPIEVGAAITSVVGWAAGLLAYRRR